MPRSLRGVALTGLLVGALAVVAACADDGATRPPAPGEGVGVATTSLTTTTLQDLDDLVNATDRQPQPTLPAGPGAASNASGQVGAISAMVLGRDGPFTGEAAPFVDAIGQELLASFTGCDVAPTVSTTTTGVGPAIGTIDLTFGCDPTTDAVQYVLTLEQPGSVENAGESWLVTSATRTPHCARGVIDGLCA